MTVLHDYQLATVDFILDRFFVRRQKGVYLAMDCGVGKTICTLEAIRHLRAMGECSRVLILAPITVIVNTWRQEAKKHGYDYTFAMCYGTADKRRQALQSDADIVLCNYENLQWLEREDTGAFDLLILDEATRIKTWGGKRTRALRRMLDRFRFRMCLSGTPTPRSYGDLHSQYFLLDDGRSLGQTQRWFRQRYMRQFGQFHQWAFRESQSESLLDAIAPMTWRVDADDYLDLPDLQFNNVSVYLPPGARQQYIDMERDLFLALENGETLTASGAGAKYTCCRQIADGFMYEIFEDGSREAHNLHDAKLQAVEAIVEEAAGKPVLVAYNYNQSRDSLMRVFPKAKVICGGVSTADSAKIIEDWNNDEIGVLIVQPQSLSHGVNLQHGSGRDIVWLSISNQLELYLQLNKRIHRQGVVGQVRVHHVLARGTIDTAVQGRTVQKDGDQQTLLDSLNEYRVNFGNNA